ncbi:hypothetical protein J3E68DRAFT_127682 [Trichoderma sp. SZMC 28012]
MDGEIHLFVRFPAALFAFQGVHATLGPALRRWRPTWPVRESLGRSKSAQPVDPSRRTRVWGPHRSTAESCRRTHVYFLGDVIGRRTARGLPCHQQRRA